MNIAENSAKLCPGDGKYLTGRWVDIMEPKPRDDRNAVEIADDFMQRHGLKFAGM